MIKKVLYINDYANDPTILDSCNSFEYPRHHLWGVDRLSQDYDIIFAQFPKHKLMNKLYILYANIYIFIKNWNCDIIYSALPGFSLLFLLCKKIGLKKYKVVSVVHHPTSRLVGKSVYDKLIFISPLVQEAFNYSKLHTKFIFWGGDLGFYSHYKVSLLHEYDFICAGKTLRDYDLFYEIVPSYSSRYIVFGSKSSAENEISYPELMTFYNVSKFSIIPIIPFGENNDIPVLSGLTSFIDSICLGIPVLMSDNTLIGIDIEKLGMVFFYNAGDDSDFSKKVNEVLSLSQDEYNIMRSNCIRFAASHSYEEFCNQLCDILRSL